MLPQYRLPARVGPQPLHAQYTNSQTRSPPVNLWPGLRACCVCVIGPRLLRARRETFYIVLNSYGRHGTAFVETDLDRANYEATIADLWAIGGENGRQARTPKEPSEGIEPFGHLGVESGRPRRNQPKRSAGVVGFLPL